MKALTDSFSQPLFFISSTILIIFRGIDMAEIKKITSPQNGTFKTACKWTKPKEARAEGVFLVEGIRWVREILAEKDWPVRGIWVSETLEKQDKAFMELLAEKAACPVVVIPDEMFRKLSDTETPQGVAAFAERRVRKVIDVVKEAEKKSEKAGEKAAEKNASGAPLLVILENLQDPGNVGTILRTLDAAGGTALVLTKGTADIFSPKVVRAAMGSLLHVPVCLVESAAPLEEAIKKVGFTVLAATLENAKEPYDIPMDGKTAIVIGNEGNGLSAEAVASASQGVKIPMLGKAESLNASVAAGILIYEAVRQRRS